MWRKIWLTRQQWALVYMKGMNNFDERRAVEYSLGKHLKRIKIATSRGGRKHCLLSPLTHHTRLCASLSCGRYCARASARQWLSNGFDLICGVTAVTWLILVWFIAYLVSTNNYRHTTLLPKVWYYSLPKSMILFSCYPDNLATFAKGMAH